ncbi:hypothetical protein FBZ89_101290 [Nitrospirillum amazonense]|uniref:Uncharacterized protein n=1 Tax=Nitrospirillum amazonense TaxID=28077 RepID=A0A560FSQ3_9PROT|nr:hypothetical protein [Nitrospirillum amazonense]TWB24664.1 hypothetical protein FBZ89_101290 [Nitrospirillum amazonense]
MTSWGMVIPSILLGLVVAPLTGAIAWCHLVPGDAARRNRVYHWLYVGIGMAVFIYAWALLGWDEVWPLAPAGPVMVTAALARSRLCPACGIVSARIVRHCPHCGAAIEPT